MPSLRVKPRWIRPLAAFLAIFFVSTLAGVLANNVSVGVSTPAPTVTIQPGVSIHSQSGTWYAFQNAVSLSVSAQVPSSGQDIIFDGVGMTTAASIGYANVTFLQWREEAQGEAAFWFRSSVPSAATVTFTFTNWFQSQDYILRRAQVVIAQERTDATGAFIVSAVLGSSDEFEIETVGGGIGSMHPVGAAFLYDTGLWGCTVKFTDASLAPPNQTIQGWRWDFGDGLYSSEQNATHTYASCPLLSGEIPVSLTVMLPDGTMLVAAGRVTFNRLPLVFAAVSVVIILAVLAVSRTRRAELRALARRRRGS